ncbi:GNAT family N-acetyltransferase [Paenibacillus sp. CF384]|uniref:GNAT family N-acetyltransferase n=1 Tax=Paenibacillus sp. CF384 TaxID=1884382 RepID=UPI000896C41A|nr:Protein N-acetyltransferase, RimJ/RimL family [Paenibacillus sp. CF384]
MMETNRLIIREFKASDLEAVHAYASDPLVCTHTIWGPNTIEDTQNYLQSVIDMQNQQPRLDYEFAVVLKESGELIGGCGLHIGNPLQAELGYCFNRAFWGKGYATEAAAALLQLGFREHGLHRMYATCRPDNLGSATVLQRIGMKFEGHLREHMRHKGKWYDSYQYSILEDEFL